MGFRVSHIAIILCACLSACGTVPPYAALPPAARDKIASTEVVMPIRQSEIYVFVPMEQGGAGFGLLGAIIDVSIDSVRTSKAEAAVKPLRDALVDYNFDEAIKNDISGALSPISWLGAGGFRVIKDVSPANLEQALGNSRSGAVLLTAADYSLSNEGDVLTVKLYASLYPNNDALAALAAKKNAKKRIDPANAVYRNVFSYQTRIPAAASGRDGNIAAWSADNGAATRAALTAGAAKLSRLLADDLVRSQEESAAAAKAGQPIKVLGMAAQTIGSDSDGTTARYADGTLVFATPAMITPK